MKRPCGTSIRKILVRPYRGLGKENTIVDQIKALGGNTGNAVWYDSVKENIIYDEEKILGGGKQIDKESVLGNILILPVANHINPDSVYLEKIASLLVENGDVRTVLIGLGGRFTSELNTPAKLTNALPDKQISALRKISVHSSSIGVRGEMTAECLEIMGIHNYRIIGCPSFYSNKETVHSVVKQRIDLNSRRISVNISGRGEEVANYINCLYRLNLLENSTYIMQDMGDFPRTIFEDIPILDKHISARFPGLIINVEMYNAFVKSKGIIFTNKENWHTFIEQEGIEFSIGTRFHGNMMALISGIPALWITHDGRTLELCEAMHLPYINAKDMQCIQSSEEILSRCIYDDNFWNHYIVMYHEYSKFLIENSLEFESEENVI